MKLLKFGATWCGPCKVLEQRLKGFDTCDLEVYDVDDSKVEGLLSKFNIRGVPVMILVDDNGKELQRWVGLVNMDSVKKTIESFK